MDTRKSVKSAANALSEFSECHPVASAVAITLVVFFLILIPAWLLACSWYDDQLVSEEKVNTMAGLATSADRLSLAVGQRVALLEGLAAFVQAGPDEAHLEDHFDSFAAGLTRSLPGVRNVAIGPGGVQRYVYPLKGNENVPGHDLVSDERPAVRAAVKKTIDTGMTVSQGPYELSQGGLGLVSRKAVYHNGTFWGLVSIVVDIPPVLNQSGFTTPPGQGLDLAIRAEDGTVFYGDPSLFSGDALVRQVRAGGSTWEVAGKPQGGWGAAVWDRSSLFRTGSLVICVLVALLVFLAASRAGSRSRTRLDPVFTLEPLTICAIYLVFSTIWILASDRLTLPFAIHIEDYSLIQTIKGILFIIITTVFLFLLIQHFTRELRIKNEDLWASYAQLAQKERVLQDRVDDLVKSREELQASEGRFRTLFGEVPIPLCLVDAKGDITLLNRRFSDTFGYGREEVHSLNDWWVRAYPEEEYRDQVRKAWEADLTNAKARKGDIRAREYLITSRDGTERTIMVSGIPFEDSFLATFVDVSEYRQLSDALTRAKDRAEEGEHRVSDLLARLNEAQQAARIGSWDWDMVTGVVWWSDELYRILELTKGQFTPGVGIDARNVHPDDLGPYNAEVARVIESGELLDFDLRIVTPTGMIKYCNAKGVVRYDSCGRPMRFVGTFMDITDRKAAELALLQAKAGLEERVAERTLELAESEERFRYSLEAADTGAWELDLVDHTAWRSLRHDQIFGYASLLPAWTYEMFLDHVLEEDRPVIDERFRLALERFTDWNFECRIRRTDGSLRWIWARGRPEFNERHEPVKMFGLVQDITDRKTAEEALLRVTRDLEEANGQLKELDRLKSLFIASMSHELRTPLNSIIGFTGILAKGMAGPVSPEQKKQLGMVQESARHLLALINDVIDISKIEAGKIEAAISDFDLSAVLREVENTFATTAADHGLALVFHSPNPVLVTSDERRIRQVILNLVSNAVKFTDEGRVDIFIRQSEDMVEVRVKDTGIGISPDDQARLFRPFSRILLPGRLTEGTGLGLYLSSRLACFLGGEITVSSVPGRGSEFVFTFPRVLREQEGA